MLWAARSDFGSSETGAILLADATWRAVREHLWFLAWRVRAEAAWVYEA